MATSRTLTEQVYTDLRADILAAHYRPGQRLRLVQLARHYDVSQSVVREALTRLVEQNLCTLSPNQGFSVVDVSIPDLEDLTFTRATIECLTFRLAIERGDVDWESRVVGALHRLDNTPREVDGEPNPDWRDAHATFHRVLLDSCGSPRLLEIASSLRDSALLYRQWAVNIADSRDRNTEQEHRDLASLALSRDADGATDLLRAHIERTSAVLLAAAKRGFPVAAPTT